MAGISISLAGNFTKLDELKDKAGKTATGIKAAFGSNIGKAMFAGIAAAGTAAFAAVAVAMKSAIDAGAELDDMVQRTGASGERLVVLQRAFELAGMAASQVPQALNRMQKALAGLNDEGEPTSKAFAKLGLSIGQLMQMDPADAFRATAEAIAAIEDPAKRTAAAMEIFGKSGAELLVLFNQESLFADAQTQVGALGETLAANAGAFGNLSDAMEIGGLKMQQVGAEIAVSLLPQLTALADWINTTDLSSVGAAIGIIAEKVISFGSALSEVAKYLPLMIAMQGLANLTIGGDADPAKAKEMAAEWAKNDPLAGKSRTGVAAEKEALGEAAQAEADALLNAKAIEKEAAATEKAAKAAEKKAEADQKAAEEKEKSRAAAAEEYRLEQAILSARLAGDTDRLAKLEREKKIRAEMARLMSAGFTAAEARAPAAAKVDAETAATTKEDATKQAEAERKKIQETLAGKLEGVRGRMDGQQFESEIGAVSGMQRVGGGGGAVGSGLDYARQAADLQREANGYLRELIEVSRSGIEV
jgi:hypothetical protein